MTLRWGEWFSGSASTSRSIMLAFATGLLLALLTSAGILGERLSGGSFQIAILASAIATGAAVFVFSVMHRIGSQSLPISTLQIVGAVTGIAIVHLVLRVTSLGATASLVERPAQLVNDVVAALGILAVVWAAASRKSSATIAFVILAAIAVVVAYRATASHWHLDATAFPSLTVQQFVVAQFAGAAFGITIFRALRLHPDDE